MSTHFAVKNLPDNVRSVLASHGYGKSDIAVSASESFEFESAYGDGFRAFATLLNLETGESKTFTGSWSGGNAFVATRVDNDTNSHTIPVNGMVIAGQIGGGRPVSARLIVNPDNMPKYLSSVKELTKDETNVLIAFRSYTSAYRKTFLSASHAPIVDSLVASGLLKRNKAGSTSITLEGKNAISNVRT